MPIVWNPSLDTGIEVIDSQHRRIVTYLNALEAAKNTKDPSRIGQIIEQLIDYTQSHFGFEESLMEEAGYRFLKPHQKVHGLFIRRVESFMVRAAKGENIASELHSMLSTWLLNHIAHEDRDYAAAVKTMSQAEETAQPARVVQAKRVGLLRRFFGFRHE
jgi:hemerythrin